MTHPPRLACSLAPSPSAAVAPRMRIVTPPTAAPGGRRFDVPPAPTTSPPAPPRRSTSSSSYQMHPTTAALSTKHHQQQQQQQRKVSPVRDHYDARLLDINGDEGAYYFDKDDHNERAFVHLTATTPGGSSHYRRVVGAAQPSALSSPSRPSMSSPRTATTTPSSRGVLGSSAANAADNVSLTTKDSTQSLSAGSTASIDSFVQLMTCGQVESLHVDHSNNSSSSSFSFDPYLSRRRKPSWARPPAAVAKNDKAAPSKRAATISSSVDGRKLYVKQHQEQQRQTQQRGRNFTMDEAEAFARRQRDIERQLQALSVDVDDDPWAQSNAHESIGGGRDASNDSASDEFPNHDHLQSSFFTAESLLLRKGGTDDDSAASADDTMEDDATDELGFPRQLTSIPTPTMTKIRRRTDAVAVNRRRSLLDVTSTSSVASLGDDEDPHHHSKSNSSSYSSAKTADAGVHSLPSSSKAADPERDRHAIQTVLHWRHIVSLRSQNTPRWITASTLEAKGPAAAAAAAAARRKNLPSLALAKAHLQLGNALLAIHEYSEACKSFQAAYKIFSVQPNAAQRQIMGMALCMERMGVATALAADPVAIVPATSSPTRKRSINDEMQTDPTFAMLVRSYTVQLESFRLRSLHLGSHHVDIISGLNHIAKLHCHNRDWVRALQCLWQVYWARTAVFGSIHPSCGVTAHDVANVFCQLRMHDDASNFYSIASHVYDTLNLPEHNPALKKLNRDVKRLERLEHRQGYNVL